MNIFTSTEVRIKVMENKSRNQKKTDVNFDFRLSSNYSMGIYLNMQSLTSIQKTKQPQIPFI